MRINRLGRVERLESRQLLAVIVTDTAIVTHHDTIPRLGAADITAEVAGDWSAVETWGGTLPDAGDTVLIPAGVDVVFDTTAEIENLEVFGSLSFAPDVVTSLEVETIHVMPSGTLELGTDAAPITASAEIVFADTPLDLLSDPGQYGHGLLVFGTLETNGRDVTPYVRATTDINVGDTAIALQSVPADWLVGDEIVIPKTHQSVKARNFSYSEARTIAAISGNTVSIEPVTYHHRGISDNPFGVEVYAHIGNLTRNIVLRSENSDGVRAHFMATADASVDIHDAVFHGLGRTTMDRLSTANPTARYSLHAHHIHDAGSFDVDHSVVRDGKRWGLVLHETNDAIVTDNIVYDIDGAGILTESGNEGGTELSRNLVVDINGAFNTVRSDRGGGGSGDFAKDSSGIWMKSPHGVIEDNVIYDTGGYGINLNGYQLKRHDVDGTLHQFESFKGNEVAGSRGGIWLTWTQGMFDLEKWDEMVFEDTLIWHVREDGVHAYHANRHTFKGLTVVGDPVASSKNIGGANNFSHQITMGVFLRSDSYEAWNFAFDGVQISGVNIGISTGKNIADGVDIKNATLANYVNVATVRPEITRLENITYLPSEVFRIRQSRVHPHSVANVWQRLKGVNPGMILEPGTMADSSDTDPVVDPPAPAPKPKSDVRSVWGELRINGSSANDVITLDTNGTDLLVDVNGEQFRFAISSVRSIGIQGKAGNDLITNNTGFGAMIYGNAGDDTIIGGGGRDEIHGGKGDDVINGGAGNDLLYGDQGADTLIGGIGRDQLRSDSLDTVFADFPV